MTVFTHTVLFWFYELYVNQSCEYFGGDDHPLFIIHYPGYEEKEQFPWGIGQECNLSKLKVLFFKI